MKQKVYILLRKTPLTVLMGVVLLLGTVSGMAVSKMQILQSDIPNLFNYSTFGLMLICYAINQITVIIRNVLNMVTRTRLLDKIYNKWFDKIIHSNFKAVTNSSTGKIFDTVNDIAVITVSIFMQIVYLIQMSFPFMTMLYKLGKASKTSIILTSICMIISIVMIQQSDRLFKFSTKQKQFKAELSSTTADNYLNIRTIKFLNKFKYAFDRNIDIQDRSFSTRVRISQQLYYGIIASLTEMPLIFNILINRHNTTLVILVIVCDYTITNMSNAIGNLASLSVEYKASLSILKEFDGNEDKEKVDMPIVLSIKNVDFDYGKDSIRFHINDLEIRRNHRYHITGESGEGKSTLANLLVGSIQPTQGNIMNVKTFYIYQETECLNDTLRNNIKLGNSSILDSTIIDLFSKLNMLKWYESLKDGLDTLIGERGCKLSQGQKQRINIIRAVLRMREHNQEIIILDEITSNLDKETEQLAIELIDKECDGTLIIISHHGDFANICDTNIRVINHEFYIVDYERRSIT